MLVDSSGSMNPPARPMATQFFSQNSLAPAGQEAQRARLGERAAIEIRHEAVRCASLVADEVAAIHVAVADPVLQRNAPPPAGLRPLWSA